jgi:HEAT repeat protein
MDSAQSLFGNGGVMSDVRMPYQIIDDLAAAHAKLSDAEVLDELAAVPPLADEADPCWNDDGYWHRVAYTYLALWNVAAKRKLRAAVPLIFDRACFGDPGEVMRNLCHAVEAIVKPDWSALTAPCVAALASPRPGTRLWAAHELGRLRDPSAIPALERAAQDAVPEVREWAASALERTRR